VIDRERGLGELGHPCQLIAVITGLNNIVCDDEMMLGIDGGLDVITDNT
jgi:hypothetical protein